MSDMLEDKNKRYVISTELEAVAKNVISAKIIDLTPARIKYVQVYPLINKKTAGRCMLANPMMKLFGDCDYIIQMSGDLWEQLDEDRQKILMWHELLHVFPIQNPKTGEYNFRLREHDIMDFNVIINTHGTDWFTEIKTMFASVYDLEPSQMEGWTL